MRDLKYEIRALVPKMPNLENVAPYISKIDESRWYSNFGPLNQQLTERLARYFAIDENMICTIANATLGLQAVLSNIAIPHSEVVEVPSFTFAASPSAILSSMRNLRFVDIDEQMRCVPSEKAKIVMDVLPFGAEPRLPEWYHKADFVLIDGAASFDALKEVGQSDIMSDRVAIVVSLHSTKLMGGGEGGIVLSKNTELITKIKAWQNFGFDLNNSRTRTSNFIGTNAKMSEYSCAVALASLDNWGENRENYLGISRTARAICTELGFEIHPAMKRGLATPNWILIPRDQSQSQKIEIAFDSAKFETRKWWNDGCHKMYAFSGYANEALPNTESLAGRYIGLPFHLYLPNEYWNRVHDLLSKCSTSA